MDPDDKLALLHMQKKLIIRLKAQWKADSLGSSIASSDLQVTFECCALRLLKNNGTCRENELI